jgi:hypothetical protein
MNALVPDTITKHEVERGSLRHPAPVPFVPPRSELPEVQDDKHSLKVQVNETTEERVTVFHGGVPEAYLTLTLLRESLIRKKDLHTTFKGYESEESNARDDLIVQNELKPSEEDLAAAAAEKAKAGAKVPKKDPLKEWMKRKAWLEAKIDNAKKAKVSVVEEAFTLHENLLGEEVRPYWAQLVTKTCFAPG